MAADYLSLSPADLRIILVHSRERILPELSESLADYARQRMQERGVTFKLNERVADAEPGSVTLSSGEKIRQRHLFGPPVLLRVRSSNSCRFLTTTEARCW